MQPSYRLNPTKNYYSNSLWIVKSSDPIRASQVVTKKGEKNAVFSGAGPDMSLLDALSAQRKDFSSGAEAALVRHAVAALLNAKHSRVAYNNPDYKGGSVRLWPWEL